jgi:hypothetical protein
MKYYWMAHQLWERIKGKKLKINPIETSIDEVILVRKTKEKIRTLQEKRKLRIPFQNTSILLEV